MNIDNKHRWFDKYPDLRKSIDKLEDLNKGVRDEVIRGIEELILSYDNQSFDRYERKFPFESSNRWYDKDPYAWLVINSIIYLDEDLITDIILYLKEKLKQPS
jgi:hypothetical protein